MKPRLLFLSLGGTISSLPTAGGGIAPRLGAAELVASVPGLVAFADIAAESPMRVAGPSLSPADLVKVAARLERAFAEEGFDGAVVVQGTDTIEESAFLLDLLVAGDRPVVVTGAMRGADAPGADGPANLLASAIVAASTAACGQGTLVVLNDEIHAARFVQKANTSLPSAFVSPLAGPLGRVVEGRARFYLRVPRLPCLAVADGAPAPVGLVKLAMGDDTRLLEALAGLGYAGIVIEGMGAGHAHADAAPVLGALAERLPVVLASRMASGPVFAATYGYAGAEIDLLRRGLIGAGMLAGVKARLLLGLALRGGAEPAAARAAFSAYG